MTRTWEERGKYTDSHATHECLNGTLAAGVDCVLWNALRLSGDGTHHDQASANTEIFICFSRNEELPPGVNIHNAIILVLSDILDVTESHNTRIGAHDVKFSKMSDGVGEEPDDVLDDGDIGLDGYGVGSGSLDLGYDFVGGFAGVGVVDDDFTATTSKLKGHFTTDSSS